MVLLTRRGEVNMATVTVTAHIQWSTTNLQTAKKQNKGEHVSKLIGNRPAAKPPQKWLSA